MKNFMTFMTDFCNDSTFFYVFLTLITYQFGVILKNKFKKAVFNPLLISTAITIAVILIFKLDINKYKQGTKFLSFLLTPVTVCLAIPLYEQFDKLKENWFAIILGILSGVITSMTFVWISSLIFKLSQPEYIALLPKSITTPIGMAISEKFGGIPAITVAVIVITGITGNIFAEITLKLFRITHPVAKGIAIGTSSHALGTAKAMELGEVEGAMSSLSIAVAGIITVILFSFFV